MNKKSLTVFKSNKIVEAGYRLSLNEQRLILYCISLIDSRKELTMQDHFTVRATDFAKMFSLTGNNEYRDLANVADQLFERYITIAEPKVKGGYLKTRWITGIHYMQEAGEISVSFARDIVPYLSELRNRFTAYKLEYVSQMTSIYAIRLYELFIQWGGRGQREVKLDWLKNQFQIEKEYSRMYNFKKRVLDPAIQQINKFSDINVKWEQKKVGRKVTHLIFYFSFKNKTSQKPVTPKASKQPMSTQQSSINNMKTLSDAFSKMSQDLSKHDKKNTYFSEETLNLPLG